MPKTPFAIKISPEVKDRVHTFCEERGITRGSFVETAVLQQASRVKKLP